VVQDESDDLPRARSATGRYRLIAGVVGACVLGAGLGLWARPSDLERPGSPRPAPAPAVTPASADRRIPIVVDDSPAPIGKPMDVLSASPPRPAIAAQRQQPAPPPPAPELTAPTRPPTGLVRVVAPVPGPMAPPPPRVLAPAPPPESEPVAVEKPASPKPAAKALKAKADAAKLAKAAHAKKAAQVAAKAKAEKFAKAKARHDRAKAAHEVELAKAAPPPKPRHGLMALAHAFAKLAPHHAKPEPAAPVEQAEAKPERHRKVRVHETHVAKAAPKTHPVRADPTPLTTRGAGPLRLASATTRCASADPGEALACGDPTLGAAERRLSRAYRDAEAAGVPSSTLKQQQRRWIAARAAAAREAPWAVREVYQARIAELQDLVRDAKGD
jgi:uncharacterized protein YecT (DUF1311 family)